MLDLDPNRIRVDDGIDIIKGAAQPKPNFFGYCPVTRETRVGETLTPYISSRCA